MFLLISFVILISSFLSFRYYAEQILYPFLGMGWAYVIDQTIPLIITVFTGAFLLRKGKFKKIHSKLKNHYLILAIIFSIALVTHLGILNYYFWSDEVIFMFEPITINIDSYFHSIWSNMRGYFITHIALLYLIFGNFALVFPLFNIIFFAASAIFVYWFLYLLTNQKLVAIFASLFFATTPIFLDMFTWQSTAHAPILILGLTSFIFLLYYRKSGKFSFYILSLMFFFVAIKMGFVRSVGLTLIPLILLLFKSNKKLKFTSILVYSLSYIMISLYFILFEFFYLELENVVKIIKESGNFTDGLNYILGYRAVSGNSSFFLNKLSFFTAYLFIPSGLVGEIFTTIRPFLGKISIAITIGNLTLLGLLIGLLSRKRLIFFAVIFIFLNMIHSIIGYQPPDYFNIANPNSATKLDERFAREDLSYGPGSRYLFISSIGVSLLFALFISWLINKRKGFTYLGIIICLAILISNSYFTIRAQVKNFKQLSEYKSLVENIFMTVPRDGKPKLLFSANPEENGLDRKFRDWTWLHGFYKKDELFYTKDPKKVEHLLEETKYERKNLYAFYNNPHTLAFKDISGDAREYFFNKSKDLNSVPLQFKSQKVATKELNFSDIKLTLMERAILESEDIDQHIILPQNLQFKINIRKINNPSLPFSDTIYLDKNKYFHNFPLKLWEAVKIPPHITNDLLELKLKSIDIPKDIPSNMLQILGQREKLITDATINVSNIVSDENIIPDSLIDGFYTTYPKPAKDEQFFVSETSPVVITIAFPRITEIKRIWLNIPLNYIQKNLPKKISAFSSIEGINFNKVTSVEGRFEETKSPNLGKMYYIEFPSAIYTNFLNLEIDNINNKPIALDEIVIDNQNELVSPRNIHEILRNAYNFVGDKEYLDTLSNIKGFNRIYLIWACASEIDWQLQQTKINNISWGDPQKTKENIVNGIWNIASINFSSQENFIDNKVPINCFGSKLRKVFFISPPYPVEMEIVEAFLQ